MSQPLAIDLFCGLGGWTEGLLAEEWNVVGIDIEEHIYGEHRYPAGLIIQDILTVDGRAFSGADLIVASPPCQFFSYTAMPWTRAKRLAAEVRADPVRLEKELALFNACFRIQREASEAAGRLVPMMVENVKGAQPWVGRARWLFGSFALWGDVPALMPIRQQGGVKVGGKGSWADFHKPGYVHGFNRTAEARISDGHKLPGFRFDGSGKSFQSASVADGVKCGGDWFGDDNPSAMRHHSSKSPKRKAASAMIAKIPFALSRHIAAVYRPRP